MKETTIDPEPPSDATRIAVTDAHRRGVLDPISAYLTDVREGRFPDEVTELFHSGTREDLERLYGAGAVVVPIK